MVERGRLEICCTFRGTEGSNPSLSAKRVITYGIQGLYAFMLYPQTPVYILHGGLMGEYIAIITSSEKAS